MEIQKRRATRYPTLANIIILCVGLLLVLGGFLLKSDGFDLSGLTISIGSDTIVVAVVFFLGRLLLIDPQDELKESLMRLEAKISESRSSFFINRSELRSRIPAEDLITHSRDLLLAGVNLRDTVRGYRSLWLQQVETGARLRFLVLDPGAPDVEVVAEASHLSSEDVGSEIRLTLQMLKALRQKAESIGSSSVEIRLLSHQPPFSFAIINPEGPDGTLSAGLRLYGLQASVRPFWILRSGDEWFDAFVDACEKLWDSSQPFGGVEGLSGT